MNRNKKAERIAQEIIRVAKELTAAPIDKEFITVDEAAIWTMPVSGDPDKALAQVVKEAKKDIAQLKREGIRVSIDSQEVEDGEAMVVADVSWRGMDDDDVEETFAGMDFEVGTT